MDVFMYRKIILDNLNNCEPLLKPLNQNMINNGHCFIQNDREMCIGWLVFGRIYPTFQSTRHKKWLHSINTDLEKEIRKRKRLEIRKRKRLLIYSKILLKIKILPIDVIQIITEKI